MADTLPDPLVMDRQTLIELGGIGTGRTRTIVFWTASGGQFAFQAGAGESLRACWVSPNINMVIASVNTAFASLMSGVDRIHTGVLAAVQGSSGQVALLGNINLTENGIYYITTSLAASGYGTVVIGVAT